MRVCLIDVDSKIPNLALMKASTWHKQRGDEVKLGYDPLFDHPDICYVSKIFDFTPEPEFLPDCKVFKGGSGYSLTSLPRTQRCGSWCGTCGTACADMSTTVAPASITNCTRGSALSASASITPACESWGWRWTYEEQASN